MTWDGSYYIYNYYFFTFVLSGPIYGDLHPEIRKSATTRLLITLDKYKTTIKTYPGEGLGSSFQWVKELARKTFVQDSTGQDTLLYYKADVSTAGLYYVPAC